jgi:hypothetical protein
MPIDSSTTLGVGSAAVVLLVHANSEQELQIGSVKSKFITANHRVDHAQQLSQAAHDRNFGLLHLLFKVVR